MKITNKHGISLPLAIWLLHDEYEYITDQNYISATGLLKSVKQIILSKRVDTQDLDLDVSDLIAARMGHAMHDSVEKAWTPRHITQAFKMLGYPDQIAETMLVNPTPEEVAANPDAVTVYLEQRAFREINGWKIGGKFDMILDGRLFDFKTTSVYTYILGRKDNDYALQGGIYRWLNPDLIQDDHIYINFIFTDWQKVMTFSNPDYPKLKIQEYPVEMYSLAETEKYITSKLGLLGKYANKSESVIPDCTPEELWMGKSVWKYYSNPEKTDGKATKNFDSKADAHQHWKVEKGGKGIVIEKQGEAKACGYCRAYEICEQRKSLNV